MAASKLKLCELGTAADTEWEKLYEANFKPFQRTPYSTLRDGMRSGQILLHTTSDETQGILCFSIVNVLNSFALLAYIATDTTKHSTGIGSKHMKQLLVEVQAKSPTAIAMVAEIESTRDKNITEEERKVRKRRLRFYQRLGFKRLKTDYMSPSYTGTEDEECELIVYPFTTTFQCTKTSDIIKEIYLKAYVLAADDARIAKLPATDTLPNDCVLEDEDQTTAPAATPATDQTATPTDNPATTPVATADTSTPAPASTDGTTTNSEGALQTPVTPATVTEKVDESQVAPVVAPVAAATVPADNVVTPAAEVVSATTTDTVAAPVTENVPTSTASDAASPSATAPKTQS